MDHAPFKRSAALRTLNVVVAGIAAALPCAAQVSVELTPVVGVYAPTSATIWPRSDFACWHMDLGIGVPDFCRYPTMRQQASPAVGGRITAWLNNRAGIDLSLAYSRSRATGLTPGISLRDTSASIVLGSARVLFNVTPRMVRTSFSVGAGVSLVAHGGDAYAALNAYRLGYGLNDLNGSTGWGPVVGIVARFMLAPALAIRADLEDHHYRISGGGFQNDVLFSLGLSATLVGRPASKTEAQAKPPN